ILNDDSADALALLTTERVDVGNDGHQAVSDGAWHPSISADGRFITFYAFDNGLVSGDTNFKSDIFLVDRQAHTIERASVGLNGAQPNGYSLTPAISGDGRYVAFASEASNLVPGDDHIYDIFLYDTQHKTIERTSIASNGASGNDNS